MKKLISFSIVYFFFIGSIFAQFTPCSGGFSGSYPCNDYDFLSKIDAATLGGVSSAEGSDNWGWVDPLNGKEYAIMALTTRTAFVDVTDPINPIYLGYLPRTAGTGVNFWRDVKVYNNHAFIVADNVGAHGMQVFDLTNLRNVTSPPVAFTAVTTYTGVNSCHNIAINESTGFAYLVGCGGVASGGPHVVDISTPSNPTFAGQYSAAGYTHDAQIVTYAGPDATYTGKEVLVGANADEIVFLDVTDKSNITQISSVTYSNVGYTHQGWFTPDFKYYILGDEGDEGIFNTRTLVFNVTDLNNPVLHTTYFGPNSAIDHNLYIVGDLLYEANYASGLRVIDISDIDNSTITNNTFTEVGYFDTFPSHNNTAFNGAWNVYPFLPSGNIIISDIESGMIVVRKSGTLSTPDFKTQAFKLYPNPAKEEINIKLKDGQLFNTLSVYNTLGQKVLSYDNLNTNAFKIFTESISKGIYIIKVDNKGSQKLVIN